MRWEQEASNGPECIYAFLAGGFHLEPLLTYEHVTLQSLIQT
jgi:hypothetical protein